MFNEIKLKKLNYQIIDQEVHLIEQGVNDQSVSLSEEI